jgi:hypothetical protein
VPSVLVRGTRPSTCIAPTWATALFSLPRKISKNYFAFSRRINHVPTTATTAALITNSMVDKTRTARAVKIIPQNSYQNFQTALLCSAIRHKWLKPLDSLRARSLHTTAKPVLRSLLKPHQCLVAFGQR